MEDQINDINYYENDGYASQKSIKHTAEVGNAARSARGMETFHFE